MFANKTDSGVDGKTKISGRGLGDGNGKELDGTINRNFRKYAFPAWGKQHNSIVEKSKVHKDSERE